MAACVVAEVVAAAANEERSVTKNRMLRIARNSAWCCLTGSYLYEHPPLGLTSRVRTVQESNGSHSQDYQEDNRAMQCWFS